MGVEYDYYKRPDRRYGTRINTESIERFEYEYRQRQSDEFVHSMLRRIRGRKISSDEALQIIDHMLHGMEPEEAHRFLYIAYHQMYPQITNTCNQRQKDKWNLENRRIEIEKNRRISEFAFPSTEDFLSKEDVIIK